MYMKWMGILFDLRNWKNCYMQGVNSYEKEKCNA